MLTNNQPTLRLIPATDSHDINTVNVINGSPLNTVGAGAVGATIAGGGGTLIGGLVPNQPNQASQSYATIGGGLGNLANGIASTVGGGAGNTASNAYSTVGGGIGNVASGVYSFAAGAFAQADKNGCFVFANWSSISGSPPSCNGNPNIARFLLDHGLSIDYASADTNGDGTKWVAIGDTSPGNTITSWKGAVLTDAGVWVNAASSKASKTDFAPVDVRQVLAKLAHLPITTWRYKEGEGEVRHMGPMAEDFWTAFNIGYGDYTIANLDGALKAAFAEMRDGRESTAGIATTNRTAASTT